MIGSFVVLRAFCGDKLLHDGFRSWGLELVIPSPLLNVSNNPKHSKNLRCCTSHICKRHIRLSIYSPAVIISYLVQRIESTL